MNISFKAAAHLDTFFSELSIEEKFKKFSQLGFSAVEFWCWWDEKYDLSKLSDYSKKYNIDIAATCTKFCSLVDSNKRNEYLNGLKDSIEVSRQLNNKILISQVGDELKDASRQQQIDSMVEGLQRAADLLSGTGITLAVEPLNILIDHKGYFLSRMDEAAEIIDKVGSKNIRILFDIYHQQITEGNLINNIKEYSRLICHYHLADNPGRHEPGSGEINYNNVLKAVAETGYDGYVGLEFFPADEDLSSLKQALTYFK